MIDTWIVGKFCDKHGPIWEFQGVFDSEDQAVAACFGDNYFVGPATMNELLDDKRVLWPGCWYPRLQGKPDDNS